MTRVLEDAKKVRLEASVELIGLRSRFYPYGCRRGGQELELMRVSYGFHNGLDDCNVCWLKP
jgi:hypothetical protein